MILRRGSCAAIAVASALLPGAAGAEGLLTNLLDSARRTPSGIAFERTDGSGASLELARTESGLPKPETGTIQLKLGDSSVTLAAEESLETEFGSAELDVGGLPKSPYLGLTGFGMMARHDLGELGMASALVMAPTGERMAASEMELDTGYTSLLLQGGLRDEPDSSAEAGFTERAFGGAAFEGDLSGVDYSLRWHGARGGSTGAFSLRHGGAAFGVAQDFGAGILSPTPDVTARWRRDLPLGEIDLSLQGTPTEHEASTRVNWTFEW